MPKNTPPPTKSAASKVVSNVSVDAAALKPAVSMGSVQRNMSKTRKVMHDLFKLSVALCQKNLSFKPGIMQLEHTEHIHFYHSIDSHGTKQECASFIAGHSHRVQINYDAKGEILGATCSEALQENERRLPNNTVKKYLAPVSLGLDKEGSEIVDKHTHSMEYMRSEELEIMSV